MAIVSTHTLNSVDGTHAGGVRVELFVLGPAGKRERLLDTVTDKGGRFMETVEVAADDADRRYELVLHAGAYFAAQPLPGAGAQIVSEVVIRFRMPDPHARYHMPLMLAPNSYSVWWSG